MLCSRPIPLCQFSFLWGLASLLFCPKRTRLHHFTLLLILDFSFDWPENFFPKPQNCQGGTRGPALRGQQQGRCRHNAQRASRRPLRVLGAGLSLALAPIAKWLVPKVREMACSYPPILTYHNTQMCACTHIHRHVRTYIRTYIGTYMCMLLI